MTTLLLFLGNAYLTEGKGLNKETSELIGDLIGNLHGADDYTKGVKLAKIAKLIDGIR